MAEMEAHHQADDLTAERAAEQAAVRLLEQMGLRGHPAASQFIGDIIAHDQQARQDALREAADLAFDHACDDPRSCTCNSVIYNELDRLASEGG